MLRRLVLGSLLVAAAISLTFLNHVVGSTFALLVLASPVVLARAMRVAPRCDDWPSEL